MNNNMITPTGIQRVTVSLPNYIYQRLIKAVPERKVSHFVARVLEKELMAQKSLTKDPIKDFVDLRDKLPRISDKKIFAAIKKGRM